MIEGCAGVGHINYLVWSPGQVGRDRQFPTPSAYLRLWILQEAESSTLPLEVPAAMPLTKTPTSSLSGSSVLHHVLDAWLNVDRSDRVARHANLVQGLDWGLENVFWPCLSTGSRDASVPCHQTSPGARRNHHRPSHLR